jgi:hypothetical protein
MSPKRIDVHHHYLTPEYVEEMAKVGVVVRKALARAFRILRRAPLARRGSHPL